MFDDVFVLHVNHRLNLGTAHFGTSGQPHITQRQSGGITQLLFNSHHKNNKLHTLSCR